ncbi:hypothetical protein [Streptomyces clavuligerus]|uniref:DUF1526 domain-containing protein n=1 Tax=Streptomyces clavuligerus TaxID=1901 RepID=B5GUA6_STRCL|nr:hypothetical protein [Streptomyces clavuligerus]ANW19144.1 hypothetical protein BB341_13415 [Streptomyces clavuligerus]AXU13728.1 hypothetical protein D1794_13905 [Streptomyces clavuligerus]EDY49902.1 conserved hypothetical protein [Streptomyces clavuligerus]EFG08106.1 DUF1526 domain-containing protein [Streptomyces clavuligerus]MBY6303703.1 hypothetical protein [Streptomyces clavuligerus]
MFEKLPVWLIRAFSRPRLSRYVVAAQGDPRTAVRLYWWNIEACGALYGPLHCLELALRNALHDRLSEAYGRPDWWETAPLDHHGQRLVTDARRKCERRGTAPTPDAVVAELSFGFWVSLLSRRYDRGLWVPVLHKAFPLLDQPRKQLHDGLSSLVLLRNRIMHHEPVHHRDLAADHAKIYRMLGYLSPELVVEAKVMDRFPDVLAVRAAALAGTRPTRF